MDKTSRSRLDFASRGSLFTYALTAVILPISLITIASELDFSYAQAGALSLVGSITQFVILLLSIPLAAAVGKIRPLRWGLLFLGLGLGCFTFSTGFTVAFLTIMVVAVGQASIESLITPLVEDVHPGDDGRHQALLHSFWPLGIIIGTLILGEALSRGMPWRYGFWALAALCIATSFLFPHHKKVSLPPSRCDFSHAGEIFRQPTFWIFSLALFFAGGIEGGLTYWTASFIQVSYGTLPRAGAMGTAAFALGMALGRIGTSRLTGRWGIHAILTGTAVTALILGICLKMTGALYSLYPLLVLLGISCAPHWPGIQTLAVRRIGADATMTMAFMSCFGLLGFSAASFSMGLIGDAKGLEMSFWVIPIEAILLLFCLLVERVFSLSLRTSQEY
ncbi:MAG: MFS transporter [Spirochaetales bacterium]|nr:MFS transporter [Spirochaetales bacterium]